MQARLAWLTLTNETAPSSNQIARADWQSRHAMALAPEDPEVLLARAQVCERRSRLSKALELMERGSRLKPARPDFWDVNGRMLEQTNRLEEAYQAYSQASGSKQVFQNVRREVWVRRANLLRRLNRPTESKADYEKFVGTLTNASCFAGCFPGALQYVQSCLR